MPRPTFPAIPPKFSPSNTEEVRESTVSFADGYELTSGDGLNMIRGNKSLEWEPITYAQMAEMLSFVRDRAGNWFYYHLDEDLGRARKFRCKKWDYGRVPDTLDLWYFKAEFRETFTTET
jgi:phage-related protein